MTNRQMFNAILDGEKPDRILWAARLDVWYRRLVATGEMPERLSGMSLYEVHKALGIGVPQKSDEKSLLARSEVKGVTYREERDGPYIYRYTETPAGDVFDTYFEDEYRAKNRLSFGRTHIGYPLKSEKDFKPMKFIIENTEYYPFYDHFYAHEEEIGEDGMTFMFAANDPFSVVMRDYAGIEQFCYMLADYPALVEDLIYTLAEKMAASLQPIMLNCPARVAHHGGHYDGTLTSPPLFQKYILPYLRPFADKVHAAGKFLALHADADSMLIMGHMERAGMDMAECFCTAPMVKVSLEDAINFWEDRVIIWGGIPSVILCPETCSYEDFYAYMKNAVSLIRSRKCRVILGVSDNVMPETDIGRLEKITEMVNSK